MKKVSIALIILSFLAFLAFECQKTPVYEVLEVVSGSEFFIDLNSNGLKDADELVKLKGIEIIGSKTPEKTLKTLGITRDEALCIQSVAKKIAISKILGEKVTLKINSNNDKNLKNRQKGKNEPKTVDRMYFHNVDFAQMLVIKGFALAKNEKGPDNFNPCKILENPRKIRKNAKYCKIGRYKKYDPHFSKTRANKAFARKALPSTRMYSESPERTFNNVAIFLANPNAVKKPSNSCGTKACRILLQNINNSKESIDFALYGLDRQNEILNVLFLAKKRGVKIRGVVDSKAGGAYVYADTAKLVKNFDVKPDLNSANMHNKFFIFDNARVFTGTMNVSTTGTGGYNANTAVLINDKSVANVYTSEFNEMYEGKFQGYKRDFSVSNLNLGKAGYVDIYFSPAGKPLEKGILPLLSKAKKEIYVSIFYLTNKEIINELIAAKARGAEVLVIYDAVGASNMKEQVKILRNSGVKLKVENWGGKNHEKNMVIDRKIFITGSANFSNSGMKKNDENILIFKNPEIARFYREYFLKLYYGLDEKYLKFTPRAESFESGNSCYDGLDNNFDGKIDKDDIGCKR